ncbi:hypothetical protein ACS3UN_12895 [Oscillospiraceae bacterium LTW-04]|nr:hypothetical protein RBH76_00705 [Oscillospiraceae bacterium MB24-C1]
MGELKEILNNLTPEQTSKIKGCRTAREILDVAKVEAIDITLEQAEGILRMAAPSSRQLLDDEIEKVTGGCTWI